MHSKEILLLKIFVTYVMRNERKAIKLEIGNRITGFFFFYLSFSCLALINFQSEQTRERCRKK